MITRRLSCTAYHVSNLPPLRASRDQSRVAIDKDNRADSSLDSKARALLPEETQAYYAGN